MVAPVSRRLSAEASRLATARRIRRRKPMKSKYLKILAIALALAVVAAVAVSQTVRRAHMHGDGMFGEPMLHYYVHKLDLTDAQQAQVKAIMAREQPTLQPLML